MSFRDAFAFSLVLVAVAVLLSPGIASAEVVTFQATGYFTNVTGSFTQPASVGESWILTYSFDSSVLPDFTQSPPKGWISGTSASYLNSLGWSLTVADNVWDTASLNAGSGAVTLSTMNDAEYQPIPFLASHMDDQYGVIASDLFGTGDYVQVYVESQVLTSGPAPTLLQSTALPVEALNLSAATNSSFTLNSASGGRLTGIVTSVSPVPLPATGLLLFSGLGFIRVVRRKVLVGKALR
ncbi:MAG: hypothetical protein ABUS47_11345 [Steroidobacter sp.]